MRDLLTAMAKITRHGGPSYRKEEEPWPGMGSSQSSVSETSSNASENQDPRQTARGTENRSTPSGTDNSDAISAGGRGRKTPAQQSAKPRKAAPADKRPRITEI